MSLDYQFSIEANAQVINVEDEANSVSTDPTQNGAAIVIGQSQIDALSDDPDVLQQQLLAAGAYRCIRKGRSYQAILDLAEELRKISQEKRV